MLKVRSRSKNRTTLAIAAIAAALVILASTRLLLAIGSDPLELNGLSEGAYGSYYYLELANKGNEPLRLVDLVVDGKTKPSEAELVISYTGQLALSGIEKDERARFLPLDAEPIDPALPSSRFTELMKGQNPDNVPIGFGARIVNATPIGEVTITYKYKGLKKTKKIVLDDVGTWH